MSANKSLLASLSEQFPAKQPDLWATIQTSSHTDPAEQKAVARAVVNDILSSKASRYHNAFYAQAKMLYPYRVYAAYNITTLYKDLPKFACDSKKRDKAVLGWTYTFLSAAGETELLKAFEDAIANYLVAHSMN